MTLKKAVISSHIVQFLLIVLVGACITGTSYNLYIINQNLNNFYKLDSFSSELSQHAELKSIAIKDYILNNNDSSKVQIENLIKEEKGEVDLLSASMIKRNGDMHITDTPISFLEISNTVRFDDTIDSILIQMLTETDKMNSKIHEITNLKENNLSKNTSDLLQYIDDFNIEDIRRKIYNLHQELRLYVHKKFLTKYHQESTKRMSFITLSIISIILLIVSLIINTIHVHSRVLSPISSIINFTKTIISGKEPKDLEYSKHNNEISILTNSLNLMKSTIFKQIIDLKNAERETRSTRKQAILARTQALSSLRTAQKAVQIQEDFLRRVSHEIRTPMNAIIGMSYLCQKTNLTEEQKKYVNQINVSGSILLKMFDRILDFSRAEEGIFQIENTQFNTNYFFEILMQTYLPLAKEKNLTFDIEINKDIPITLYADKKHLEECLSILLDNAIRYTNEGSVSLKVNLLSIERNNCIRIEFIISDTGPGMPEKYHSKIFEAFTPGDTSLTRSKVGLGLGLPLAKHLINIMGGELYIKSDQDIGTVFSFALIMAQPENESTYVDKISASEKTPLILIVDDNEINCEIANELLKQAGLDTIIASNGKEAIDMVQEKNPSLILMDVQMPVMDGLEASKQIRNLNGKYKDLPIVALTAHNDQGSKTDIIKSGMNEFLTKPIDPQSLYSTLEKLLKNWHPKTSIGEEKIIKEDIVVAPQKDFEVKTKELQIINFTEGLATVGGNERLYEELLDRFVNNYAQDTIKVKQYIKENNLVEASKIIHKLKGVSGNLSFEKLHNTIKTLDSILPDNIPDDLALDNFETAMTEIIATISKRNKKEKEEIQIGSADLSDEQKINLTKIINDIENQMEKDWGKTENDIYQFVPYITGTIYAADYNKIINAINDFDKEVAKTYSDKILEKLNAA